MKDQVAASWYDTVRASGVSESDAEIIRGAFVYPGFLCETGNSSRHYPRAARCNSVTGRGTVDANRAITSLRMTV